MKTFSFLSLALACLVASQAHAAGTRHSRHSAVSETDYSSATASSTDETNMIGFQFGPQIATASMSVDTGTTPDADSRTRMNLGAFYEHAFTANWILRPELNFSERGFSMNGNAGSADFSANYFEVPVMVKAQLPLGGAAPYIMTGPFMGLLIGKGVTINTNDGKQTTNNLNNQVNSFNFGWNFGLGSSFNIARNWKLDAGLRYSLGLTNIASTSASGESTKLSAFQILAGLSTAI